jgi:hypothetical protein
MKPVNDNEIQFAHIEHLGVWQGIAVIKGGERASVA